MTVTEGTVLGGRYVLGRLLGRGGMAEVYRATDEVLHRQVAVKVLQDSAEDPSSQARFTSEGRTLAKLNHPSLVTVLDAGTEGDLPFLVLQLVDGPTLAEVLRSERLPRERVAQIGAAVADGLGNVHENGIVHRDVKPGNVLLTQEGSALLADFGIARLLGDTTRHTRTGLTLGTVAYVSPEQVRGEQVTPASDVYSLGLVLLEALTGQPVYEGTDMGSALARLHGAPSVPEDLPSTWRDLLEAMTRLDAAARPSATEVATALGRLSAADSAGSTRVLPVGGTAALPPAPSDPPRSVWRQRGVLAAAAAVLVVLLGIVALVGTLGSGSDAGTEVPEGVPTELQEPLADLHDAVEGEG